MYYTAEAFLLILLRLSYQSESLQYPLVEHIKLVLEFSIPPLKYQSDI